MLQRFYVDNFKTLINVEWRPAPVNLLIGPNNAGKTNLCAALRFLSLTSQGEIKDIAGVVGEPWQLHNVHLKKPAMDFECSADLMIEGQPCRFDYALSLDVAPAVPGRMFNREYAVRLETLAMTPAEGEEVELLRNDGGRVSLLHEKRHFENLTGERHAETHAPTGATMLYRLYDPETNPRANAFKQYLVSWSYFGLNPQAIRQGTVAKPLESILWPDGSNLASVIHSLKNVSERDYRTIVDLVRELEPDLDAINFVPPALEQVFMFFEDRDGNDFATSSISDGTLRFLAMAFVLVSTARRVQNLSIPAPLIMFEEPENGIYVGQLRRLFNIIDRTGKAGQFVITTHSPYFIDLFDDIPEWITVVTRRNTHTELKRPDPDRLRRLLEGRSLGELHFRELLVS